MNKKVEKKDFDNYLAEARTWETDKVQELTKSKTIAWRVASASGVVAFVSVLSVAMLTPLKSVEPYVIRVDNSTGIVDVVKAMDGSKTNYDEAVNKYFTQWYVRYREGYSKDLAEVYYSNVGIMSVGHEQQKYFAYFNPKNPLSPINLYGPYAKVKIRVKSTSFIKPDVALVRYTREVERGSDQPQITHWAATITFKYSGAPMLESDRGVNPLGFQVVEYRNDPDQQAPEREAFLSQQNNQATTQPGVTAFAVPEQQAPLLVPAVPAIQQ